MCIRLAAVARRDLKTRVSVGTIEDAPLSADAASALAGRFYEDRAELVGRMSGWNG
jgi:hypothetical protein